VSRSGANTQADRLESGFIREYRSGKERPDIEPPSSDERMAPEHHVPRTLRSSPGTYRGARDRQ
jgi:hypothetical protein